MEKLLDKLHVKSILTFITCLLLTIFIYFSLSQSYLCGDVYNEGIPVDINNFLYPIHGRYFAELLERIIGIANLCGIHPMDFINTGSAAIISIIYTLFCFVIATSIFINKKKDLFFPVYILLIYIFTYKFGTIETKTITQFFGYSTQIIFLFIILNIVIKYFIEGRFPETKKEIFQLSLTAFLLGMASEYSNLSFFIFLILLSLSYILYLFINHRNTFREIFSKYKAIIKKIFCPLISFFISFILTYLNPQFWLNAKEEKEIVFSINYLINMIADYNNFFHEYFRLIIWNNKELYIVIFTILLFTIFLTKDRIKLKRFIIVVSLYIVSSLLFFTLLIICGKEWLDHKGLIFLFVNTLIYMICCSYGFCIANIKVPKFVNIIIQLVIITALYIYLPKPQEIFYNFIYINSNNYNVRQFFYKFDKMTLLQFAKGQDAYLPETYMKEYRNLSKISSEENIPESYKYYIQVVYNKKDKPVQKNIYLTDENTALDRFKELGGEFTYEELNPPKFRKLKKEYEELKKLNINESDIEE